MSTPTMKPALHGRTGESFGIADELYEKLMAIRSHQLDGAEARAAIREAEGQQSRAWKRFSLLRTLIEETRTAFMNGPD